MQKEIVKDFHSSSALFDVIGNSQHSLKFQLHREFVYFFHFVTNCCTVLWLTVYVRQFGGGVNTLDLTKD